MRTGAKWDGAGDTRRRLMGVITSIYPAVVTLSFDWQQLLGLGVSLFPTGGLGLQIGKATWVEIL